MVALKDYSSCNHQLLISILEAIAIEVYECKTNENPDYINVMLNSPIKPYNMRDNPHAEQHK